MTPSALPTAQTPQVYLEDPNPARRVLVNQTLAHLATPNTPAGQGTQATLTAFIGQANSQTVAGAVQTHGAEAVQIAAETLANRLETYRAEGMPEAQIPPASNRVKLWLTWLCP